MSLVPLPLMVLPVVLMLLLLLLLILVPDAVPCVVVGAVDVLSVVIKVDSTVLVVWSFKIDISQLN